MTPIVPISGFTFANVLQVIYLEKLANVKEKQGAICPMTDDQQGNKMQSPYTFLLFKVANISDVIKLKGHDEQAE